MKKIILLVSLVLVGHFANAQNWQCLQYGVKRYFLNSSNYLRGMRIDSVKSIGDTVIYYPFHTPRGLQTADGNFDVMNFNGGSWLGSVDVFYPDGTFIIRNEWGDSEIIKIFADSGTSWLFYADTSNKYYLATMLGSGVLTILDSLDSVRTILIQTFDSSGPVTSDQWNNFKIIISKNHGIYQAFNFCSFPDPVPNILNDFYDYYAGDIQFDLINFYNPTMQEVFNYNAGTILEYTVTDGLYNTDPGTGFMYDSVISNNIIAGSAFEIVDSQQLGMIYSPMGGSTYGVYNESEPVSDYPLDRLLDTTFMPEESNNTNLVFYTPNDGRYCPGSNSYTIWSGFLFYLWINNNYPGVLYSHTYNIGSGLVYYDEMPAIFDEYYYSLSYSKINGVPCGYFQPVPTTVSNVYAHYTIKISPNPATTALTIQTSFNGVYNITLFNTLGQQVYCITSQDQQTAINISQLLPGIYTVQLTGDSGQRYYDKVVVEH